MRAVEPLLAASIAVRRVSDLYSSSPSPSMALAVGKTSLSHHSWNGKSWPKPRIIVSWMWVWVLMRPGRMA